MVEMSIKVPFQNEHSHQETAELVQIEALVTASCTGGRGQGGLGGARGTYWGSRGKNTFQNYIY